jgi:transposase
MKIQKQEVLSFVQSERLKGRSLSEILEHLQVPRSNYYRWVKGIHAASGRNESRGTVRTLTEAELLKIDEMKERHPEMRHRQIQGML